MDGPGRVAQIEPSSSADIIDRKAYRLGLQTSPAKHSRGCWTIPDTANQQDRSVGPLDRTELSPRARAGTPSNLISYRKCQLLPAGSALHLPGTAIAG